MHSSVVGIGVIDAELAFHRLVAIGGVFGYVVAGEICRVSGDDCPVTAGEPGDVVQGVDAFALVFGPGQVNEVNVNVVLVSQLASSVAVC